MADPKLKKVVVQIKYWSDDGYIADMRIPAGGGQTNLQTGELVPPEQGLRHGLDECLRLLYLFGFDDLADQTIADVKARVVEWRRARQAKAPKFQRTHCSQCGGEFGPGDHGFSHCSDHSHLKEIS